MRESEAGFVRGEESVNIIDFYDFSEDVGLEDVLKGKSFGDRVRKMVLGGGDEGGICIEFRWHVCYD